MSNVRIREIISVVAAFVLFISVSGVLVIAGAFATAFNGAFIGSCLDRCGYVEKSCDYLCEALEDEAEAFGVPKEVFVDAVDRDLYMAQVKDGIEAAKAGEEYDYANISKMFGNDLKTSIEKYLTDQGIVANDAIKSSIGDAVREAEQYYGDYMKFDFGVYVINFRSTAGTKLLVIGAVCLVLSVLAAAVCIITGRGTELRGKGFIAAALLSSGVAVIGSGVFIYMNRSYKLPHNMEHYGNFVSMYFEGTAFAVCALGVLSIVAAVIFMRKRNG